MCLQWDYAGDIKRLIRRIDGGERDKDDYAVITGRSHDHTCTIGDLGLLRPRKALEKLYISPASLDCHQHTCTAFHILRAAKGVLRKGAEVAQERRCEAEAVLTFYVRPQPQIVLQRPSQSALDLDNALVLVWPQSLKQRQIPVDDERST